MNHLFSAMRVFLKVADTHHFSHAAHQLNLSPSLVTRYVGDLESHLGVKLLQRSTRKTVLTGIGIRYAEACRALLTDLAEIESRATQESSRIAGDLNVVVLHSVMSPELAGLFADYQSRHPDVRLHITLTESEVDLLGGGFDAGIVADTMITSVSVVSRTLVHAPLVAVASPAYLLDAAAPRRPVDLAAHRIVGLATGARTYRWAGPNGTIDAIALDAPITVNSALMQRQLALAGSGVALLPEYMVANDLRIGTLTRVLDDYRIVNDSVTVSLVYPGREFLPGKVRAFVDLTAARFRLPSLAAPRSSGAVHAGTAIAAIADA
ncbi:LysR family transcriptional regulator [Burkholderia aenigmatica]|uniref:LysR family transcriptional regulator n=1 Tax=Burkholderia aenigmatica TaxID=2015348 RepID=A0ABY6XMP2_9BURK|nr:MULTISPECIES: LysR family transcriptional regulator [Burkholderia]VWC36085.1 LysR family transcriptional regulator [Burkholderia aenigmatica]VWC57400.1 LysR family transcriptional regulator [Burkholderia aenigmatica]VWC82075.1 LysR family transcriptional regulator [Burkholderia aenigmatica]